MKQSQKNCLQSPEMLLTSAMDGRAVNNTQILRVDITMQRLSLFMRREALFFSAFKYFPLFAASETRQARLHGGQIFKK